MLNNLVRKLIYSIIYLLACQFLVASGSVFVNQTIQLSSPRTAFGYIEVDNKIYFAGGFGLHDSIESNVIDVLDLSNNNMSQLTLGSARGMITPVVIAPRIYFIGGFSYTNVPFILDTGTFGLTTSSFTSGPTIRRPRKLSLSGTTLTVIGSYSVDFMNIQTGLWKNNPKLTQKMNNLRGNGTMTFAHQNYVFVIGGYNLKSNEWSSSVWFIDSPSSDPTEYQNQALEKTVISSTFDAPNQVVVFVYSDMVMVFSINDQLWFNRDTSAFVSALSYADNTIVFLSDGYWTLNWSSKTNVWTPVSQLTLAFAIADQFVYTTYDSTTGWRVAINTGSTPDVEYQTLLPSLEGDVIQISVQLSSTVFGFATQRGNVFKYDASKREFAEISMDQKTPQYLFRLDNNTMCVVSGPPYTVYVITMDTYVVNQKDVAFLPMALIGTTLIDIYSQKMIDLLTWQVNDRPGTVMPPGSLWAQEGSNLLAMPTFSPDISPSTYSPYNRIDVYNYEQGVWEAQLIRSGIGRNGYIQAAVFNDILVLPNNGVANVYNQQSGWSLTQIANFIAPLQNFQTFTPIPSINGTAYFPYISSTQIGANTVTGMNVVTWPLNVENEIFDSSTAYVRYIVPYESKMLFLATRTEKSGDFGEFTKIITYDIASDHFDQTLLSPPVSDLSLVMYDDFLLAFTPDKSKIDYFYPGNNQWGEELFDNSFMPAVLRAMPADNSSTFLMTAGGFHRDLYFYTDAIQFMVLNLTIPVVPATPVENSSTPLAVLQPEAAPADDSKTIIIIAVVVPVGAIVIAGVVLAVLLTRRNQKKKRVTTTSELEARYGQWFTPFSEIQFGTQLGQGASGQVFEGTWKNTRVALKVSPTQANASVISELELMIKMRPHPNVIQLFGFTVHPETNSVVLIIEFCDGGSLDGVLYDTNTQLTTKQKLAWIHGAAKGLNHLHSNNVVHRDVAARNILLHQNEPKLTDFGMSRFVEEDQKGTTRSELGPIRWMSPESLKLKQYSNKSDVWSFGILMYEIMVQQEPHNSMDPIDVARQIRDQGLVPTIPPSCPQKIASIMQECWNIDPEKRPTMGQLVEKIEQS